MRGAKYLGQSVQTVELKSVADSFQGAMTAFFSTSLFLSLSLSSHYFSGVTFQWNFHKETI